MTTHDTEPIKVFISYSHDSAPHKLRVLDLADKLRIHGIDCYIDQYVSNADVGWPQWMVNEVREADYVLVVCTKTYLDRFEGRGEPGKGRGAKWEGAIITQQLYEDEGKNAKFIPVFLAKEDSAYIPFILKGVNYYNPTEPEGYEDLYRRLTDQPGVVRPDLGKLKSMPPKNRKQDFTEPTFADPTWHVPYDRNAFFTGRQDVLERLRKDLTSGKRAALAQAISGLGGVGKTQTAVEYAYQYRDKYKAVFWVKAETREELVSDYAAIAGLLDLPQAKQQDQNLVVAAVKRWFESSDSWLLIFDNADKPEIIKDYVPHEPKGHVLLTSRAQVFDFLGITSPVELDQMQPEEAQEFLLRRTGREDTNQAEKDSAAELAEELGYFPLALEQAGAYIHAHRSRFDIYLTVYRKRRLKLLEEARPVSGGYSESVAKTWAINFDEVEKDSKASADLLQFSAFVSPDNIPNELIAEGAPELGSEIAGVLADVKDNPLLVDELLEPLTRYSLVHRNPDSNTYSIHRMVQEVLRYDMREEERKLWAERTVCAVNVAFPKPEFLNWSICERLLPHATVAARLIEEHGFVSEPSGFLLNKAGGYLHGRAQYSEAKPLLERSLAIREEALGVEHPDTAMILNDLAALYRDQGRYHEAEPLFERALAVREKALGRNHPGVAMSLNNLAGLCRDQGRYREAEPLLERALTIKEKSLGPDHPGVATGLNNLARLYTDQGRHSDAEPLLERSLAIREKTLGPEHPDVANSLHNLAWLYVDRGLAGKAVPMCKRALEILEKSVGPNHPDVAWGLENYARALARLKNVKKAKEMLARAKRIRENHARENQGVSPGHGAPEQEI